MSQGKEPARRDVAVATLGRRSALRRVLGWLWRRVTDPCDWLGRRHPFAAFFLLVVVSNIAGSIFSFGYNTQIIIRPHMNRIQEEAFWDVVAPLYNVLAYPVCVGLMAYFLWPLGSCLRRLRRGQAVEPEFMEYCRRRVIDLPRLQVILNVAGWLPGAVFFPAVITLVYSDHDAGAIWAHFAISFVVSALFTTAQTFFTLQYFLVAYLYPDFFRDARPEDIRGVRRISYVQRLMVLWLAVAWMPLVAMFVALDGAKQDSFAVQLFVVSTITSAFIFFWVGRDLLQWIKIFSGATAEVARENFQVRIAEQRPDEWGQLNNRFNDMAAALERAQYVRETFGEFVSPQVSQVILDRLHGLDVDMREITVLFVDIRGFSSRCAAEQPERVGALLNRFLTLTLYAIEENGGYVNSFLGDGAMALFNAPLEHDTHADLALVCAAELLERLAELNSDLKAEGVVPLRVGIGIHTGPALVGCFGARLPSTGGRERYRRQFTAIGETVNTCQRIEQLTKKLEGPILLSDRTRARLRRAHNLACMGPHALAGAPEPVVIHRVV